MPTGNDVEELAEVQVSGRDPNPGAVTRVRRARETFAPGSFLPRVQALLNPRLYRERSDTNALMEQALAEDGPLGHLAASNPTIINELRQQAEKPMSSQQHQQFRSTLIGLVQGEVERESKIRSQVANNEAFMQAFSMLDGASPGIKDPARNTLEESERRQVSLLYQQAQELALLDPEASQAIMVEVRKKADTLTANVRQQYEQLRKRASLEDVTLYSNTDNAIQLLRDAHEDLSRALSSEKTPPDFVIQKALDAYGAAGIIQATSLGQVGTHALGEAIGGGVGGATAGGMGGAAIGAGVGLLVGGGEKLLQHFKDKKNVAVLAEHLVLAQEQALRNYQGNRAKLVERYAPLGIEFGEQQGEVYAVLDETYRAEADKIPEKVTTKEQDADQRTLALRTMLDDELASADAAVAELGPDAAANLPGAAQRLAAALTRQQVAQDDLAIFEDDLRLAAGREMPEGVDASAAIEQARLRRRNRSDASTRASIRRATMEALRSHTR